MKPPRFARFPSRLRVAMALVAAAPAGCTVQPGVAQPSDTPAPAYAPPPPPNGAISAADTRKLSAIQAALDREIAELDARAGAGSITHDQSQRLAALRREHGEISAVLAHSSAASSSSTPAGPAATTTPAAATLSTPQPAPAVAATASHAPAEPSPATKASPAATPASPPAAVACTSDASCPQGLTCRGGECVDPEGGDLF